MCKMDNRPQFGEQRAVSLTFQDISNIIPVHRKPEMVAPTRPEHLWAALDGGPQRLYACVDAAKIPNLVEHLEAEGLRHACMFDGAAAQDYGQVAPWLVELPPGSRFLDRLFAENPPISAFWPCDAAIFLHSSADLGAVRQHLKRLTKIPRVDGEEVYFRFWDPQVAHGYFTRIADWPERVASLLISRHARIDRIIVPLEKARSARMFMLAPQLARAATTPSLRLTERDLKILADLQWPRLNQELCDWLQEVDPVRFRGFGAARLSSLAAHVIREGRAFGFRYKEEFAYLLYMMTFLGGWFHKAPQSAAFTAILAHQGDTRFAHMSRSFPALYQQLYGHLGDPVAQMQALWSLIEQGRRMAGGWADLEAHHVAQCADAIARRLGWSEAQTREVAANAAAAAQDARITSPRDIALHHVLWLSLGPYPLHDPLQPWVAETFGAARGDPGAMMPLATYALRRLTRRLSLLKGLAHD
jgi:hypothetical protein